MVDLSIVNTVQNYKNREKTGKFTHSKTCDVVTVTQENPKLTKDF